MRSFAWEFLIHCTLSWPWISLLNIFSRRCNRIEAESNHVFLVCGIDSHSSWIECAIDLCQNQNLISFLLLYDIMSRILKKLKKFNREKLRDEAVLFFCYRLYDLLKSTNNYHLFLVKIDDRYKWQLPCRYVSYVNPWNVFTRECS